MKRNETIYLTRKLYYGLLPVVVLLLISTQICQAQPIVWNGNGHAYEFVLADGIDWPDARDAATTYEFQGFNGYLATVTSQEENDFIAAIVQQAKIDFNLEILREVWLGAEQLDPNGPPADTWAWVTAEPFDFTHWENGEPNDTGGDEHYLGMWGTDGSGPLGEWNDQGEPWIATNIEGFIVEYDATDELQVVADQFDVYRGIHIAGELTDSFYSDDSYLKFHPGFTINSAEAPVWLIFDGTLPIDNPTSLGIVMESNVGTPGLTHTLEAWNWSSAVYDVVDVSTASFNEDVVVTASLSSAISDYAQAETGAVRTRVGWRKTGFTINYPWEVRLDQLVWTVQ